MLSTSTINLWTNDVPWRTPAWEAVSFDGLTMPDVRGDDRVLPGEGGTIWHPRRETATTRSIHMHFYGRADPDGVPYADTHAGLEANFQAFHDAVLDPSLGLLDAVFHRADGTEWDGHIQGISPMQITRQAPWKARVVVTIILPYGRLLPVEES